MSPIQLYGRIGLAIGLPGGGVEMKKCLPYVVLASLLAGGSFVSFATAVPRPNKAQQTAPDNSKANQGDQSQNAATADQQKENPGDLETTRKIRRLIIDDKSLSTYAHNVKVITENGEVTLKGPVDSEAEKRSIERKAISVAGVQHVTNQLEVVPKKNQ